MSKNAWRGELRRRRRELTPEQQELAARRLAQQLVRRPAFRDARRIAFYLPNDGEISPWRLLLHAARMGKECYLPVLKNRRMVFYRYRPGQALRENLYGIPEPAWRRPPACDPQWLDIVLTPLVGFDRHGNRLGMGGGFYDRTFRFMHKRPGSLRGVTLLGLAHHCQEVPELPTDPWDVPLHGIATDREVITLRHRSNGRR